MKPLYTQEQFNSAKTYDKLPCECYICGKSFLKNKKELILVIKKYTYKNGKDFSNKAKYCSIKCRGINSNKRKIIKCKKCETILERKEYQIKNSKTGNQFCSNKCCIIYNNENKSGDFRRSKLEIYLEQKLTELYPNHHILFNNRTTINSELDIYFSDLNLAFELNGIFHYEPIYGQDKLNQIQNNDNRKFQACLENGIELCIIDTSSQINFKEKSSKKFLDIIIDIIQKKMEAVKASISPCPRAVRAQIW